MTTPDNPPDATIIWISEPLNAVTISGSITYNIRALESANQANYGLSSALYKVAAGNGAATRFNSSVSNTNPTELGTSESAQIWSFAPTSTAFADGDMLALMLVYVAKGGTSASGRTSTGFWAGTTSGASGDTFLTFTETITAQTVASTARPQQTVIGQAVQRAATRCWTRRRSGIVVPRLWTPEGATI